MRFPFGETVTVLRAVLVEDPYSGESGWSWDDPVATTYEGCAVWPATSEEPGISFSPGRVETVISVALPAGADVRASDRLVVRGVLHDVVGKPFPYKSPLTGWEPGLVVCAEERQVQPL